MLTQKTTASLQRQSGIGRVIIFRSCVDSTNDTAFEQAGLSQDPHGLVVIADSQTRGRGRLGRKWESPPAGNIYLTVVLVPGFDHQDIPLLSLAAPVAAARAIHQTTGLDPSIKWPNDIEISGRKAGGILIEARRDNRQRMIVAAGIGINVNSPVHSLSRETSSIATSIQQALGRPVDRIVLIAALLAEFEKNYKFLLNGNKGALIESWISINSTIGKEISVRSGTNVITGLAVGISTRGELEIRMSSGTIKRVSGGDVSVIKKNVVNRTGP